MGFQTFLFKARVCSWEKMTFAHCRVQLQTLPLWQLRQVLCQPVAPASLGITSALGPMKMSPSRAPAMTRTCLGLPTLEETQKEHFSFQDRPRGHSPLCPSPRREVSNKPPFPFLSEFCVKNMYCSLPAARLERQAGLCPSLSLSLSPPLYPFLKNFMLKL